MFGTSWTILNRSKLNFGRHPLGNDYPNLMAHLKAKRAFHANNDKVVATFRNKSCSKSRNIFLVLFWRRNAWHSFRHDSGSNSTYVIHRCLSDNPIPPTFHSVSVADGFSHPIVESGTLFGHPDIRSLLITFPVSPRTWLIIQDYLVVPTGIHSTNRKYNIMPNPSTISAIPLFLQYH